MKKFKVDTPEQLLNQVISALSKDNQDFLKNPPLYSRLSITVDSASGETYNVTIKRGGLFTVAKMWKIKKDGTKEKIFINKFLNV